MRASAIPERSSLTDACPTQSRRPGAGLSALAKLFGAGAGLLLVFAVAGAALLGSAREAGAQFFEGLQRGMGGYSYGRQGADRYGRGTGSRMPRREGRRINPRREGQRIDPRRRPGTSFDRRGPSRVGPGNRATRPGPYDRRWRPPRRPSTETVRPRRPVRPRPNYDQAGTRPYPETRPRPQPCRGQRCPDTRPPTTGGSRPPRRPPIIVGLPPFFPPVPPPPVYFDPPPPPPPTAGGQPPRATPPSRPPPQRVARTFGGQPPSGEARYVPDEVLCVLRDDLNQAEIDAFIAEHRLAPTDGGNIHMGLIGVRVFRYRITDGRSVPQAIAELQGDQRAVSIQPNYLYELGGHAMRRVADGRRFAQARPTVRTSSGGSTTQPGVPVAPQYVITKLRLVPAHRVSRGDRVLVAVIDSGVDTEHPELAAGVVQQIDVTDDKGGEPHMHGTAMTGAIVSQSQLTGVAPAARVVAIRAFAPRSRTGASGTSFHIARAIDLAAKEGVRIINLSLAGPNDPYVRKAIAEAHARGIIMVAAAGNAGPSSPPLYPAAYPEVIAVTATDSGDRLYDGANQGDHIDIAAPGVDVLVPAPRGAYGMTTGTSVAAAHVSGVIALMLARNPMLDPASAREALLGSVRAATGGRRNGFGAGHADADSAVRAAGPFEPQPPVASGQPTATPARLQRR